MDKAQATELVAERFSRIMNATTSPIGVVGDPPIAAASTAVFLVAYLAARRSDAPEGLQTALLVLVASPLAVAIFTTFALLGARSKVIAWLAAQPFPVENMNAVLNGLGDALEITFAPGAKVPETPALNAKLDAIHPDCFVIENKDDTALVKIGVVDSKRNPAWTNHQRYRRVLEMTEKLLVPLHAESPILTVRVR